MAESLGLILASALAGGAAGAGGAAEQMGQQMQKSQDQQDLVRLQSQLDEEKQMRLQEVRQNFERDMQGNLFQHQDTMQKNQQDFLGEQGDLNRASEEKRSAATNATSVQVANIHAGATTAAERMRIDAENGRLNKPQIIQTENGPMMLDPSSGKASPVTGPDGKPVGGMKMTQIDQVAYQGAQKIMLDPLSTDEQKQAAGAQIQSIANKYSAAGTQGGGSAKPAVVPTQKAIDTLKSDPSQKAQFDAKFGVGAADKILGNKQGGGGLVNSQGVQPATTPAAAPAAAGATGAAVPTPAAPPPNPTPAPYQPSALIAGAMTPQNGPPPTQPAFKQPLDAFGRPIAQNTVQNSIGL